MWAFEKRWEGLKSKLNGTSQSSTWPAQMHTQGDQLKIKQWSEHAGSDITDKMNIRFENNVYCPRQKCGREFVWFYPHWTMWKSEFCVQPLYPPNIWYSKAFIYSSILISYKCVVICETKCVPKWLQRNSIVLLSHIQKIRLKIFQFLDSLVFLSPNLFFNRRLGWATTSILLNEIISSRKLKLPILSETKCENVLNPVTMVWRIKEKSYEITYILSNDI